MSNERAKALLEKAGSVCEAEPDWIKEGQKPDFYCSGSVNFWCEVKTLERPEDFILLADAHIELRKRAESLSLPGRGFAYVSGNFNHRDAKKVTDLLRRGLLRFQSTDPPERIVALVPNIPNYGEFVRFSISTKEYSNVEFHSCVSATGKYDSPTNMFPEPSSQTIKLRFSSGKEKDVPAHNLITTNDNFRVAVDAQPDNHSFKFMATIPTGPAKQSRNVERIREAVSEANNQLKNGNRYKAAPSLLMLFHEGIDVPEEEIIKSAFYGDLKYSFQREKQKNGKFVLEGNGVWNRDKNRTTSAVMYVRNNARPLIIHNYWSHRPFPRGVFSCKEIIPLDDGSFEEIDHSLKSS